MTTRTRARAGIAAASLLVLGLSAGAGPVLHLTAKEIDAVRDRIARLPWARKAYAQQKDAADAWLAAPVPIPAGETGWYHDYFCPDHAVMLRYDAARPDEHVCPADGKVWRDARFDAYWRSQTHARIFRSLYALALVHRISGERRHAEAAARILRDYAAFFPSTTPHGRWAGKGRIMAQSLDEAVAILQPLKAYELLAESDALTPKDRDAIENAWFKPTAELLERQTSTIHNIHCWHNAAIGMIGFLLGDRARIEFAIENPRSGFLAQVEKGVSEEGFWFEGSTGYHFYTLSALVELVIAAERNGVPLVARAPKLKRMFEAPIALADPFLVVHATNDGGAARLTSQAAHYEHAAVWYPEERAFREVLARAYGKERTTLAALLHGIEELPPQVEGVRAESALLPATGFGILRGELAGGPAFVLMDFGPHGGGHGHPDKLNVIVAGLGRTLAPDLGTSGYGIPLNGAWYRQSVSHNVVVVDGKSQKPAAGTQVSFNGEGAIRWVTARCDTAYPGVAWTRTAALLDFGILLVDRLASDRERRYEWVYHNHGAFALEAPPAGSLAPESLPAGNGYEHLANARSAPAGPCVRGAWRVDGAGTVALAAAAAPGTTVVVADGPGNPATERLPALLLRRTAAAADFVVCLELVRAGGAASVREVRATAAGEVLDVQVETAAGARRVAVDAAGVRELR